MRPIDGDKLIAVFYDLCGREADPTAMFGLGYITAFIESKKVALTLDDLRPKGRWIPLHSEGYNPEYDPLFEFKCSECHNNFANDEDEIPYNFCPNCGADMRGGEKDEFD